jgi:hypothetical protein
MRVAYLKNMQMAALWLLLAATACAQGTTPKLKPEDYPVHVRLGELGIAADYLVHSIPGFGRTYVAEAYLVVEVAMFPARGQTAEVKAGGFAMRLNGKKERLSPQAPEFVAASLKYPDWTSGPSATVRGDVGNTGVILGRPAPTERFPGDPSGRRLPNPPRAPDAENRSGQDAAPAVTAPEAVLSSALPEGPTRFPVSGCLYFAFKGKLKSIKSLELLYGEAALKLR